MAEVFQSKYTAEEIEELLDIVANNRNTEVTYTADDSIDEEKNEE